MPNYLAQKAKNLSPSYFALVMATGTLSIAVNQSGFNLAAALLLYFNIVIYMILLLLFMVRLVNHASQAITDMASHSKGPGFFAIVAGTCILGNQLITVGGQHRTSFILWIAGILFWIVIMYFFFFAVTTRDNKPDVKEGINGAWLIAAVSTQSVSILGTSLSPYAGDERIVILFFSLCMYLLGCALYLNIIALIFYRFTFLKFTLKELTPPYWINMGAVANAVLAGSTLILHARYWPLLEETLPSLKLFTLFFWVIATWWIPLLFMLMAWRLLYHRKPIEYNAQYWSMVFPLAMYTAGTHQLANALETSFLFVIPNIFLYITFVTWLAGFALLARHLLSRPD